jgi:hypothetical protein
MSRPLPALPANLPAVRTARLPTVYVAAKTALAECSRIDECKDWADKAAALASYAKQAEDETLLNTAVRIQARAIKRCGELLRQIAPAPGGRPSAKPDGKPMPAPAQVSRSQAAKQAGLSSRQKNTALRVANVPEDEFERRVESDKPPTVTKLAALGTKATPRPVDMLQGRDPNEARQAAYAVGHITALAKFAAENDPEAVARGQLPALRAGLRDAAQQCVRWLNDLITECTR